MSPRCLCLTTTSQRRVATPPRRGQGQITFLVEKAWRYERTKVVKVALSLTHAVWGVGAWYASLIYTVGSGAVSLCVWV